MFHNTGPGQLPGLIVMSVSDLVAPDLDRAHELFIVLINANDEEQSFALSDLAGRELALHLVQMAEFDSAAGAFTVPGRTAVVFEFAPQEMIRSLIDEVAALRDAGILNNGQANSLIVKLENAIKNLDKGKAKTTLNNLNAFMNEVQSLIDEGVLTPEEGQSLIAAAEAISYQIQLRYQLP